MVMRIKIDYKKAAEAFEKAPEKIATELRRGLMRSLEEVSMYAKAHHRFRSRSGDVERSIYWRVGQSGLQGEIYLDTGVAKHAAYLHTGTGRYGPNRRDIKIKAKTRKALYWVSGGRKFFAKHVTIKGIRPDPFLYRALRIKREMIKKNFNAAFIRGLTAAGVK